MELSTFIKLVLLLTILFGNVILSVTSKVLKSPGYDCTCGEIFYKTRDKIYGGKITKPNAYPWQTMLRNHYGFYCGGSIINDRYILTAGHCVEGMPKKNFTIHLGAHNLFTFNPKRHQEYKVKKIILHENYHNIFSILFNSSHPTYDIALLKLNRRIIFTDFVKPICLSNRNEKIAGKIATVIGWGWFKKGSLSEYLRETQVEVFSKNECRDETIIYDKTIICTNGKIHDSCRGDSGGPLFYKNYKGRAVQIGIVSFSSENCGEGKIPSYYGSVQFHLDWIQKHTKSANYCKK